MSFKCTMINDYVYCEGGMSAEIAFCKYIAFRTNKAYAGWKIEDVPIYVGIISENLKSVCDQVRMFESASCKKPVLIAPGFITVPYIVELCNMVYLPSQFLVSLNSLDDLEKELELLYNAGIKAYAEVGFDGCLPNHLVAWIKFTEIPQCYLDVIEYIHGSLNDANVILSGVTHKQGNTGENFFYRYGECKSTVGKSIEPRDIYMLHINACYGKDPSVDWDIFRKVCPDFNANLIVQKRIRYLSDWESGFATIDRYIPTSMNNVYHLTAFNTKELYMISYELSKEFVGINNIPIKGVTLNPYFFNNPSYEAQYGYIAYSYWHGNQSVQSEISDTVYKDLLLHADSVLHTNDIGHTLISMHNKLTTPKTYYRLPGSTYPDVAEQICKNRVSYEHKSLSVDQLFKVCKRIGLSVNLCIPKKDSPQATVYQQEEVSCLI
jgi:hypothetical protein